MGERDKGKHFSLLLSNYLINHFFSEDSTPDPELGPNDVKLKHISYPWRIYNIVEETDEYPKITTVGTHARFMGAGKKDIKLSLRR